LIVDAGKYVLLISASYFFDPSSEALHRETPVVAGSALHSNALYDMQQPMNWCRTKGHRGWSVSVVQSIITVGWIKNVSS
jgi:hypothetical protein